MLVDCIENPERLAALGAEWDRLLELSPRPSVFLSWPWVSSWWEVAGEGKRLAVVTVRESDGRLIGLLPTCISKRIAFRSLSIRALKFLGQGEGMAADHVDLLAEPARAADVAQALAGWLSGPRRGWDTLELIAVGPDSNVVRHLAPQLAARGLDRRTLTLHSRCPYLPVPADMESFWSGLSYGFRKNLRRYRRKVEQAFKVEVSRCERPEDLSGAMSELARLHNQRKSQQGLPPKFEDPRYLRFHELVAARMQKLGRLALYSLKLNGRTAAVEYGFRYAGVLYEYQTGFDSEFEDYGVMNILDTHIIEQAIAEGLTEIDLLRGEEAYKHHWTKTAREQMALIVESQTPRGLLHRAFRTVLGRMGAWHPPSAIESPAPRAAGPAGGTPGG